MSSPRVYSRCCTNSTECPKNGLLCMPEMKPSTTCRARRSRCAMRAMVAGWKNRRGSSSLGAAATVLLYVRSTSPERQREVLRPLAGARGWSGGESRRENLLEPLVAGQFALAGRRLLDQLLDDRVGGDA